MVLVGYWIDDEKYKRGRTQLIIGDVMYRNTKVSKLGQTCAPKKSRTSLCLNAGPL
jgi:hypothetical protein